MQVGYLGPLEVRDGDRAVPVPGHRLRQLLAQLALEPGAWLSAGALADAVWGGDLPADPANSLQSLVSRLRRALGRPEVIEQSAAGYRLAIDPDDVDAARFAALVGEGHRLADGGDDAAADAVLTAALDLWRGEPLADDDSPEAAARRAALADLRVQALRDRAALAVRAGRGADAVAELESLAAAHPLREDLALVLMDALVAAGRPAEALAAFERLRTTLAETLGADPGPALRARHLEVLRLGERAAAPPTNLRAAVTSFIGREDDARAVQSRIAGSRLVTVVGAGGSGKTRLVNEVAARLAGAGRLPVPDGIWLIELAPVTEPTAVAQAVLDGLGVREVAIPDQHGERRGRREARDRLLDGLSGATCLLVVDNCEHLVDAVADLVAEILGRCPAVRVLATSREPLGIDGETLYPLGPLAVPPEGASLDEAAANPAVQLLLERGRAVDPDVPLDDAVVEIVRRLDGLPLAIELAAARLRVLTPAEVAERLADRFRLLTGGRRTATPRHRTLRAVVEWSWDLLSPVEREVAEHFAVFASGATPEAVAAVVPSWRDGAAAGELADVLHALVDKSLLTAERTPAGTRFRMLETLREYGSERLAEQGAITAARAAHARWFTGLVAAQDARLRGPGQLAALEVLDTERDDILVALRYLGDAGDAAGAVGLVVHLGWYWMLRENGQDAARWSRFALDVPGAAQSPQAVLAEALQTLLSFAAGPDMPDPRTRRAELVELAGRLGAAGSAHPAAKVLQPLLLLMADDRTGGDALLARTLADADPWVRAAARLARIAYAENDGDVDTMRQDLDAGVSEWEALGDNWGLATVLSTRGQVRTMDGDLLGAAEDYERAQACIRHLGATADHTLVTMRLADLRLRAGDTAGARRHLEAMRRQHSYGAGETLREVLVAITDGSIGLIEEDDEAVARALCAIEAVLARIGGGNLFYAHGAAIGHGAAGGFALRLGRVDEAAEHLRLGYQQALLTSDRPILAAVAMSVANCARALGRHRDAAVVLGAATRLRGIDDPTNPNVIDLVAALRAELGAGYDVAYAEGLALDAEAATARIDPGTVVPEALAAEAGARR